MCDRKDDGDLFKVTLYSATFEWGISVIAASHWRGPDTDAFVGNYDFELERIA